MCPLCLFAIASREDRMASMAKAPVRLAVLYRTHRPVFSGDKQGKVRAVTILQNNRAGYTAARLHPKCPVST